MTLGRATATVFVSIGVATALFQGCAAADSAGPSGGRTGSGASTGSGTGGSNGTGSGGTTGTGGSSTGGTFGTGGSINPGNPDATADVPVNADAACSAEAVKGERRQTDLYMMMDNSGSMDMIDAGQTLSRWANLAQAIPTFVNDPVNAGMEVGLDFFPEGANGLGGASCNIPDYTMPNVAIDFLPGANNMQANAIITAVQGRARGGGTPTVAALTGALQVAKTWQMNNPSRALSVLFLTDGQPTGCTGNSVNAAAGVAQMYSTGTPPIKTYVLGVGPDAGNLDAIAQGGGTMMAYMVTNGGAAELAKALAAIRTSTLSCDYNIPQKDGGMIDPTKVNVQVKIGATGMLTDVFNVGNAAGCSDPTKNPKGEGWYYDNPPPGTPTKITLCPNSCGPLQMTTGSEIDVLLGCAIKPIPPPSLQ